MTRSAVALAACLVVAALPATAEAKRCPAGQFDRGGQCTRYKTALNHVIGITRAVMATEDAKAAIVRIDVGDRKLVNHGFGESMAGVPAHPKMHFRPGSMTIPLLTAIALQLQDRHKLDLDDTLSRWFPEYPNANRITLRMLASVTSGYPDYIQENPAFQAAQLAQVFRQWTDDELLAYAFKLPLVCAPGACFHYAHTNFILLGRVLEKVTGRSVTSLMKQRFLRPLKMRNTRITKLPYIPPPVLHAYSNERNVFEDSTFWSPSWGIGSGVMMTSNAADMIREIKAIGRGRLFSRSAMRQFTTNYSRGLPGAPSVGYGLGIALSNGWMLQNPIVNGYAGVLAYLPSQKLSVLIDVTHGPSGGGSTAVPIFEQLTRYLSPNNKVGK